MSKKFTVRFAGLSDKPSIMCFIKNHWSQDHILGHDHALFDFQYLQNNRLNFVLAIDPYGSLSGVLGYICYGYHKGRQDIALALWKVIPNLPDPYLGVKLVVFLQGDSSIRNIHCVGVHTKVLDIYKYLGFKVGILDHYAAFNKACTAFRIAKPPTEIAATASESIFEFREVKSLNATLTKLYDTAFYNEKIPYKTRDFFLKRYVYHPYFKYKFYETGFNSEFQGFVVAREVKHDGGVALRIIEVVSSDDKIASIIEGFATILNGSAYEYVDVYASGLGDGITTSKNFVRVSAFSKTVVPEYFEPFEMRNVDIHYVTTADMIPVLFKGDGDQDRPNFRANE